MRNLLKDKTVLLVGAHPDDIEIGLGGTISKYKGQMKDLVSIIFAPCLEDPDNRGILKEYRASMKALGTNATLNQTMSRDVLEDNLQEVRDILHVTKESLSPDVIFCPSINDLHQDHRAVASACKTIFRDTATVLSYEVMRSTVHFTPNFFVALSHDDLTCKLQLLKLYKTQARRTYFKPEIVEAMARYRGVQVSTLYAEAFEMWRWTDR